MCSLRHENFKDSTSSCLNAMKSTASINMTIWNGLEEATQHQTEGKAR